MTISRESSYDSLFDEATEPDDGVKVASTETPPIPGLWAFPGLLPDEVAGKVLQAMSNQDAFAGRDQVMLFTRPNPHSSSLPSYLLDLHDTLRSILEPRLPSHELSIAFNQNLARQVILNLYPPGQGISPHIDLPNRYADGIIGVSLTGGCTMVYENELRGLRYEVYLPERTIYVMMGEARWEWSHGIEGRTSDVVHGKDGVETRLRSTRVSVTFRWMKEGADILA